MKIDEAVKLMEKGYTCLADCSPSYSFKIKKDTLIVFNNNVDNRWRTANMCPELLKAEWELVEEDESLSSKVKEVPDRKVKCTYWYCYKEEDIKIFI